MNSLDGVRRGSQRPRIEHYPLFHTTAADDAVQLAEVAGLVLDEWQEYVLRGALGERRDGRWTSFRTCLVVPRQNGKNAILEARELAGLLLFGEQVITHTAHQFKTAYNSMTELMTRIKSSELIDLVKGGAGATADDDIRDIDGFKTGNNPSITMKNGNTVKFLARSGDSGRGFTGDLVVFDEAYSLKSGELSSLVPTMSAKSITGNPQIWFTSSAGMPDSEMLSSMRAEGISGTVDRLSYFEWSAEDDADPLDVDSWYQANPALGVRISEEYVHDEYATLVGESGDDEGFKRERLGIWAPLGGERVFPAGLWSGLADESSESGERLVFAVEIAGNRESATIMAVSQLENDRVHVEVVDSREGTSWIGHRLAQLQVKHSPEAIWAIAGGHVESLVREWRDEGVKVRLMSLANYTRACGVTYSLIKDGLIVHLDDPILNDAVDGVQQTWTKDRAAFYWSRKNSLTDITPLVGLSVGVGALQRKARSSVSRGKAVVL